MIRRFEYWTLMVSTVAAAASGIALHIMKEWMSPTNPFAVVNHPWQPYVLKMHLLSVPFLLFALGLVFAHALDRLTAGRRRGRRSGILIIGLILPLSLSGVLIQVLTEPTWVSVMAWTHLACGLLYAGFFAVHKLVTPSTNHGATETTATGAARNADIGRAAPRLPRGRIETRRTARVPVEAPLRKKASRTST